MFDTFPRPLLFGSSFFYGATMFTLNMCNVT